MSTASTEKILTILALNWDSTSHTLTASVSYFGLAAIAFLVAAAFIWRWWIGRWPLGSFEIDQAEIGVGKSKLLLKPNLTDRQIAYSIWVELSTRKIGLEIDFEHDVIAEIYDSWYQFFSVTRELVKGVPVSQVKRASTQAIIRLSIEVLNQGLRPHLTRWQARFRYWYGRELKRYEEAGGTEVLDPQQIERRFPQYEALRSDMERVNQSLMRYRAKMQELIMQDAKVSVEADASS